MLRIGSETGLEGCFASGVSCDAPEVLRFWVRARLGGCFASGVSCDALAYFTLVRGLLAPSRLRRTPLGDPAGMRPDPKKPHYVGPRGDRDIPSWDKTVTVLRIGGHARQEGALRM